MGRRSRSRSRDRDRDRKRKKQRKRSRSRSRDRERKRDRKERRRDKRSRTRSRSRSPVKSKKSEAIVIRSRSNSPDVQIMKTEKAAVQDSSADLGAYAKLFSKSKELEEERNRMKEASERVLNEKEALLAPLSTEKSEEEMMAEMMGFSNFDTTQNKGHEDNDVGESRTIKQRKYRQYMNRRGGFNRPLDSM